MSSWNDLVQKIYDENKHKNGFKLKNAMKMASPIWAKTKNSNKNSSSQNTKTKKGGRGRGRKRSTRRH